MNSAPLKPRGYHAIKAMAAAMGVRVSDLQAMAPQNDPFYCGSPAQDSMARWFAQIWYGFGYTAGVHLRRVHYQLVSQHKPLMHDGEPYQNTERCWKYLCGAGKYGRYQRLVSADAFVDRRNPRPQITVQPRWEGAEPRLDFHDPEYFIPEWGLPAIDTDLSLALDFSPPAPEVLGYGYDPDDQPYYLGVWVEKSTMDDVLLPVCQSMGANLVTSLGFQSITGVVDLLKRIARRGKPARLFYVSDFDPAGDSMPSAVARQIEYWLDEFAADGEVKLTPIALTREQVTAYQLPRTPIKDSDLRKGSFEDRHGTGAVELDALEALNPGALAQLVRQALAPYRDLTLSRRLADTRRQAQQESTEAWRSEIAEEAGELARLERQAAEIADQYRAELEHLSQDLEGDLTPIAERLEALRHAIKAKIERFEPDLPERPDPDADPPDESEWLFDSSRRYLEQMAIYHERQNGA